MAEQISREPAVKKIFIIATSGYAPDMFPGRSTRAGFDHHLVKPVDFQTLISLLYVRGDFGQSLRPRSIFLGRGFGITCFHAKNTLGDGPSPG
jgi:hypothetical protein